MKRSRYSPEQIAFALRQAETGYRHPLHLGDTRRSSDLTMRMSVCFSAKDSLLLSAFHPQVRSHLRV